MLSDHPLDACASPSPLGARVDEAADALPDRLGPPKPADANSELSAYWDGKIRLGPGAATFSDGFEYVEPRAGRGAKTTAKPPRSRAIATEAALAQQSFAPEPARQASMRLSFELALVSDYRLGGVSRSNREPAAQLAIDAGFSAGWDAGIWASTTGGRASNVEVALYGSKTFAIGEVEISFGVTGVANSDLDGFEFGLAQASITRAIGPIDATLAVNYAWEQPALDNEDSLYLGFRARTPIGRVFGSPLTLGASVGRSEGSLAIEQSKTDWSVSLAIEVNGVDIGFSYVDTDLSDERGEGGWVFSLARSF